MAPPFQPLPLRRLGFGHESEPVAAELTSLWDLGLSAPALVRLLRLLAAERQENQSKYQTPNHRETTEQAWALLL